MRKGNLFVISGPSGAGKGTLVARLLRENEQAWVSVSVTTRKPRDKESEGIDYFFVSKQEFENMIDSDQLLEWACVHGSYYGTPRKTVEEKIALGQQVILEIDVQGAFQIREKMPSAYLIFIAPPSLEVLEKRLRKRGTETEENIQQRMETARVELSRKMEYDMVLVNDELAQAVSQLCAYIKTKAQ